MKFLVEDLLLQREVLLHCCNALRMIASQMFDPTLDGFHIHDDDIMNQFKATDEGEQKGSIQ